MIGLASPGATLTVALYAYAKEEGEFDVAFAIAAILMILTLLINLAAGIVGKQIQKRSQQYEICQPLRFDAGRTKKAALLRAADFCDSCIHETAKRQPGHWYGLAFEPVLKGNRV